MRIDQISFLEENCTGCLACVDICPLHCIQVINSSEGFKYSKIDTRKCINCGKCYNVCPINTYKKNKSEQHLFACYSKDQKIRNNGSSGGLFQILANECINHGFYICGAAFDDLILKHRIISTKQELLPLLKSKYIQSDTEGIYCKILKLLQLGEKVLFSGTPCQVSALQNFVPDRLKYNLLTIDFICHGVPSQNLFNQYISTIEVTRKCKVIDFQFRRKDNRYRDFHGFSYHYKKNHRIKEYNGIFLNSSFYNAFKEHLIYRRSCYNCKYTSIERVSDITLADFWGVEKYKMIPHLEKGVSMLITNTEKGKLLFNSITKDIFFEEFPLSYGVDSNYCLTHRTIKPLLRDKIFEKLANEGYSKVASQYFEVSLKTKIYWELPFHLRKLILFLRNKM